MRSLGSGLLAVAALGVLCAAEAGDDGLALFRDEVRPLLAARCFECHGAEEQRSELRLDSLAAMRAGGERGPALVPGHPEASRLIAAVRWADAELEMPPKQKLADTEVESLTRWIALGAPVPEEFRGAEVAPRDAFDLEGRQRFWCFQPLADPAPPAVRDEGALANDVDRFVQAELEAAGLAPNPRADAATLLRRLSFDLLGLPPTPEETTAFLADDAPGAWERQVERLLASPRYGERWGRHWLDLVRYAETKGHEFDYPLPNSWRYRDYVIRALNADVPYDRFVREHLAGDLLPEPRPNADEGWDESPLGTAFWYLGEEVHSPVDIRGDQVERVANQVDVLSKAFLGVTVACARCHDHKFDAIRTEDYYGFAGFALSSTYRQVRYETAEQNALVAQRLDDLDARQGADVLRATAGALEEELRDGERLLALVRQDALSGPDDWPPLVELSGGQDVLLADFEGDDWGGWETTGTAFGVRPVRVDEVPAHMGPLDGRGQGVANSYAPWSTDRARGTLTSPPFGIEHEFLHFLVGGGPHAERTCVQLLVDGEVVAERTGRTTNRMEPARFALAPWSGRRARVRLVDDADEGWGQVGADQFVLSNSDDAAVLDGDPESDARRAEYRRRLAASQGVELERLDAWCAAVEEARADVRDPLHAWAIVAGAEVADPDAELARLLLASNAEGREPEVEVLVDTRDPSSLRVEGPALRAAPPLLLSRTSGLLERAYPWLGVHSDPFWDVLRVEDSQRDPGKIGWTQPGRTARTPTFTVPPTPLYYLVEGAGHVFACIDGHRMLQGPLHGSTLLTFASAPGPRWVTHDLTRYAGHRVHLEFSPQDPVDGVAAPFGLLLVATAEAPPLEIPHGESDYLRRILAGSAEPEELARRTIEVLRDAGAALAASLPDGGETGATEVLDRLLRHRTWLALACRDFEPLTRLRAPLQAELATLRAEARPASRTAPAIVDLSGTDEFVLVRGSHRSPAAPAPRRHLAAIDGDGPSYSSAGSGRLALARRLVAADDPLVARVAVNRAWHHLFGRGLVATVDNFGKLGEVPTHPALLDWLATRFRTDDGWSTKALLRRLVTSEAYRRSAGLSADLEARDPTNRLLARANVKRLEGEALRDAILAVAGTLDPSPFGPPVPVHLTAFLDGRGKPAESGPLDGAGRRSIYQAVRRNFPATFFSVFDAPSPTTTIGRRGRSNVPAQALALRNDPFVVEQARRWAEHELALRPTALLREHAGAMIARAFGRAATDDELDALTSYVAREADVRGVDGRAVALWADVGQALFEAKEFRFLP